MRSFPFDSAHAQGVAARFTLTMRDKVVRLTTHNQDISDGVNTWSASAAVNITQIQYTSEGSPAGADIRIAPDPAGPIRPGQATRGELDGLAVKIEFFNPANLAAGYFDMMPGATIGSAQEDANGVVILAVQGPLAEARKPMAEIYTLSCKAKLGDNRCKIPLDVPYVARGTAYTAQAGIVIPQYAWARVTGSSYRNVVFQCTTSGTTHATVQPTYPTTIGATVTDGTCVFTCRQAYLCGVTGQALDFFNIQLDADPNWDVNVGGDYALGNIIPRTGPMQGVKIPIRSYDPGTRIVTLFEAYAPNNFPAATDFDIHPGCDKILQTCKDVFNNVPNMRATPFCPASDVATGRS